MFFGFDFRLVVAGAVGLFELDDEVSFVREDFAFAEEDLDFEGVDDGVAVVVYFEVCCWFIIGCDVRISYGSISSVEVVVVVVVVVVEEDDAGVCQLESSVFAYNPDCDILLSAYELICE